jgi:hypothetical protein
VLASFLPLSVCMVTTTAGVKLAGTRSIMRIGTERIN